MNHAEWEKKVDELQGRIRELRGIERLGPEQLKECEWMLVRLEKFLLVRMI